MSDPAAYMDVESKIGVMLAISLVSLFAVSFPTLSKQLPFLHIPPILFFVGKHFGTGVILATAFLHLLDDAFRSLRSPVIEKKYGKIGKWTGLVILGSLLAIFLIEYASTTYVEHLRTKPSAPSTPVTSSPPSPKFRDVNTHSPSTTKQSTSVSETTPLLFAQQVIVDASIVKPSSTAIQTPIPTSVKPPSRPSRSFTPNVVVTPATSVPHSQSRPHSPPILVPHDIHSHPVHHSHVPHPKPTMLPVVDFIEVLTNSPRICRLGLAGDHQHHHHQHDHEHHGDDDRVSHGRLSKRHSVVRVERVEDEGRYHDQHHSVGIVSPTIGRKRQIVSILVLQLGIMIHSLVIGLTLAVAAGSDFTSLTTAIMFHQLFEGLSLGIRIAALPPPKKAHDNQFHDENGRTDANDGVSTSEEASIPNQRTCTVKHSPFSSDRHYGSRNWWRCKWKGLKNVHWLEPTLSFLFAVTTPFGMTLGILMFGPGRRKDAASMLLIQGIMSAISAGMLIYAATVEMIAGDFVFGDVEGGHHHHEPPADEGSPSFPGHEHDVEDSLAHWVDETRMPERGRPRIADRLIDSEEDIGAHSTHDSRLHPSSVADEAGDDHPTSRTPPKQATLAKRVLAVASLLLGVVMMIIVGIGE